MNDWNFRVAILYNEDGQISRGDPQDLLAVQFTITTAQTIYEALTGLGYPILKIAVRDSLEELEDELCSYSPKNTFIFNNCDSFRGNNKDAVEVIRLIERMGFKHTGAQANAIELCINKGRAKQQLIRHGVPTPKYEIFDQPTGLCRLEYPLIVKPLVEDASMGIDLKSVVTNQGQLLERVGYIVNEYAQPAIVEEFIAGRELSVAMWGNEEIEVLPIAEDDFSYIANPLEHLLTFDSKWHPDSPYYQNIPSVIPARLTPCQTEAVRRAAQGSFHAMELRDLGRVDIRLKNGVPYVIDINELPDLSTEGGFWHSAQAAGISYPEVPERIMQFALKREGWIK